jgi:hypothetical protein
MSDPGEQILDLTNGNPEQKVLGAKLIIDNFFRLPRRTRERMVHLSTKKQL